jgi:HEAT repeat protein
MRYFKNIITMQHTLKYLANTQNAERWKAIIELEKFGYAASDHLISSLKDNDKWVRYISADALANIGDPKSVKPLIELLVDSEQDVRFASACALGKLCDNSALVALKKVLITDNAYVKIAAEEAIEKIDKL